ncbi:unnamed protein product, partial [Symbiodinium pilosum]
VGIVAVPLTFALVATAAWAWRPAKDLLVPEFSEPLDVGEADDSEFVAEFSDPTGSTHYYSNSNSHTAPVAYDYGVNPAKAQSARCILCSPNQCTLDYSGRGAWTSCPVHAPYFSEAHCKCVSSRTCQDTSPVLPTCSLCQDCVKKPCVVQGRYLQCPPQTPFYMPNKKLCSSSCQPAPGPAPPPYKPPPTPWMASTPQPGRITPLPMPAPLPTPSISPLPSPSPSPTTCKEDTGGSCSLFGCSSSRGKTKCKSGKCVCDTKKGYCAKSGKCVKTSHTQPYSPSPVPSSTSTCRLADTGTSCRWSSCDPKLGYSV